MSEKLRLVGRWQGLLKYQLWLVVSLKRENLLRFLLGALAHDVTTLQVALSSPVAIAVRLVPCGPCFHLNFSVVCVSSQHPTLP